MWIELIYNPPCCKFPGGSYDARVDNYDIRYDMLWLWDEDVDVDDDCNRVFSAMGQAEHVFWNTWGKICEYAVLRPHWFKELLASEHRTCQLKLGRALSRQNRTNESGNVELDSSPQFSCIEQAMQAKDVSQLASVLADLLKRTHRIVKHV